MKSIACISLGWLAHNLIHTNCAKPEQLVGDVPPGWLAGMRRAPLAAGAATRYIAPFVVGVSPFHYSGSSFARYIPSRRLACLAVVDRFHRRAGPDHRAIAVPAPSAHPAAQAVR